MYDDVHGPAVYVPGPRDPRTGAPGQPVLKEPEKGDPRMHGPRGTVARGDPRTGITWKHSPPALGRGRHEMS